MGNNQNYRTPNNLTKGNLRNYLTPRHSLYRFLCQAAKVRVVYMFDWDIDFPSYCDFQLHFF